MKLRAQLSSSVSVERTRAQDLKRSKGLFRQTRTTLHILQKKLLLRKSGRVVVDYGAEFSPAQKSWTWLRLIGNKINSYYESFESIRLITQMAFPSIDWIQHMTQVKNSQC